MSVVNAWIHMVFSTKNRQPYLTSTIRREIFQHMHKNALKKKIEMDFVNGYYDHCHCLFKLPATMSVADAAQLIKGESSHWINEIELMEAHFEWQDDYYAVSVSPKEVPQVRNYIRNQEAHHKDVTFEKEIEKMGYYRD